MSGHIDFVKMFMKMLKIHLVLYVIKSVPLWAETISIT